MKPSRLCLMCDAAYQGCRGCLQVLDDVRYDKIAAVRAAAAAAWAEFNSLPDPPAADDATPAGKSDKEGGSSTKLRGAASSAKAKGGAGHYALRHRWVLRHGSSKTGPPSKVQ
jgi:hypothetical protein